jgi:methylmalonyl-CoA mutase C-terminal domain/subunit
MNREARKIRILMAKPGLDSHDVGIRLLSRVLRDEGMEVIFLGIRQSPERIVETAIQEDVDFIGMSFHSLAHKKLTAAVIDLLKRRDATDKMVLIGGNILKKDIPEFKAMGVMEVFPVETPMDHIVKFIKEAAKGRPS